MASRFQAPRGTQDILPELQPYWSAVHAAIADVTRLYGFQRIDTPVFESAALFEKGSGDTTDIVEKEMYRFEDRGGDQLALTPEGTPAICRAYLEHGMASWPQPVRLFTTHTMFRYDRPQKGRYQEFYQCDVDVVGSDSLVYEAELAQIYDEVFARLGLEVVIKINNRKVLAGIAEAAGISDSFMDMTIAIDKLDKIGMEGVEKEMAGRGIPETAINKVKTILKAKSLEELNPLLAASAADI